MRLASTYFPNVVQLCVAIRESPSTGSSRPSRTTFPEVPYELFRYLHVYSFSEDASRSEVHPFTHSHAQRPCQLFHDSMTSFKRACPRSDMVIVSDTAIAPDNTSTLWEHSETITPSFSPTHQRRTQPRPRNFHRVIIRLLYFQMIIQFKIRRNHRGCV